MAETVETPVNRTLVQELSDALANRIEELGLDGDISNIWIGFSALAENPDATFDDLVAQLRMLDRRLPRE